MRKIVVLGFLAAAMMLIASREGIAQEHRLNAATAEFRAFYAKFIATVHRGDKAAVASMTSFPVIYGFDAGDEGKYTKNEFLKTGFRRMFGKAPKGFLTQKNPIVSGNGTSYTVSTKDATHLIFTKGGEEILFYRLFGGTIVSPMELTHFLRLFLRMHYFTFQNLFLVIPLSLALICYVGCSSTTRANDSNVAEPQIHDQTKEPKPCETEPYYGLISPKSRRNMESAWNQFVANGRYRIACDSDADFALDSVEPKNIESYSRDKQSRSVTNWGDWKYPRRLDDDHLAVIVVDTTRSDANRFGLVIFSAPKTKKDAYDVNWLYKDRDLSRASVGMASGSGWFQNYTTDGKRSSCSIVWNRNKKVFECKVF